MVFFFYGENSYAARAQIEMIKGRYEQKTGSDFSLEVFDMSERTLSDLLNAIAVQPLFTSSRLIIIKDLALNKVAKENIAQIVSSIPDTTIAIIWQRDVDRRSSFFKVLNTLKNAQEFKLLDPTKLATWVKRQVSELEAEIEPQAVTKLIEMVGTDQWQLMQEILKLASYGSPITIASVNLLVASSPVLTIFKLTDAISYGDTTTAMAVYQNLIISGSNDQQILTMITWQFRNLVLAHESVGDYEKITREFGISPFVLRKSAEAARSVTLTSLKKAYKMIVAADYAIKSGAKSSHSAVEDLIYQLTNS